jgi:hypothetical protein
LHKSQDYSAKQCKIANTIEFDNPFDHFEKRFDVNFFFCANVEEGGIRKVSWIIPAQPSPETASGNEDFIEF